MAEVPYSCIGTLTIVRQEETPKVGSLILIGLGPISNGHTTNTRIGLNNSIISIRLTMTYF